MRLLVDQNVPRSLVQGLREAGHDAEHAGDMGLSRATDVDLISVAQRQLRVVVTYDGDFSQLVALSGSSSPSVVHLRLDDLPVADVLVRLLRVLSEAEGRLDAGAIASVQRQGYRLHPLPIER